jgi:hypothetical protein
MEEMAMEKNIWLTSKDLMDRWGINAPSLWDYIQRKSLSAHPIAQDGSMRGSVYTGPNAWTWVQNIERGFQPLKEPSSLDDIMQSLNKFVFHIEEIVKFERTHRIGIEPKTQKENITNNRFERNGDTWSIFYDGKETTINDSKGIRDIAYLLSTQPHGIEALALFNAVKDPITDSTESKLLNKMTQEQLNEQRLRKGTIGIKTKLMFSGDLREENIARYKRDLKEIDEEIAKAEEEGNFLLIKELKESRATLEDEVLIKAGKSGEQEEKARKAVATRIKTAIENIKQKHRPLGDHLSPSIKTGKTCAYQPEQETAWDIKL